MLLLEAEELAVITINGKLIGDWMDTEMGFIVALGALLKGDIDQKYDGNMALVDVAMKVGQARLLLF